MKFKQTSQLKSTNNCTDKSEYQHCTEFAETPNKSANFVPAHKSSNILPTVKQKQHQNKHTQTTITHQQSAHQFKTQHNIIFIYLFISVGYINIIATSKMISE